MNDELQPCPGADRRPPGTPVQTAVAVEDQPPAPRRGWTMFEAMPVIIFLLFLAALSLNSTPDAAAPVNIRALLLVEAVFYALILFYIYTVVALRHKMKFWLAMKWVRTPSTRPPWFYLIWGCMLSVLVQLLSLPVTEKLPIERLFQTRNAAFALAAFGIVVAPLVEELIFRGFIYGALEFTWGVRAAVWISGVLFAAIHVPQLRALPQILVILVVGLVLSWLRAQSGSLAAPYFVHLGYNTSLFIMLYVATQGFRRLAQ